MTCKNVPFVRILAVAAPLLVASQVMAQEGGGGAEQSSAIADFFKYQNCGTVGYLIMVLSVIAGALMIENFMNIKREKLAPPDLLNDIEALFDGENFQEAVELCEQEKNYLTNVVGAGLSKLGHAFETMQTTIR